MPVEPRPLEEVIWVTPAMRPNWRSRGVATAEAMVSGLAPGRPAPTEMVGKSTCGSGATGKNRKATTPDRRMAKVISDVAREAVRQPVKGEINHRRGIERKQLAENQTADDGDAQRATQF